MNYQQNYLSQSQIQFLRTVKAQVKAQMINEVFQLTFNEKNHQRYLQAGNIVFPVNISDFELLELSQLGYLTVHIDTDPTTIVFSKLALEYSESRRKRILKWSWTRGDTIALISLIIALITALAALAVVPNIRNALHLDAPLPEQSMASFCASIKSGAFDVAYAEYSTSLQGKISFKLFEQQWQQIVECEYNISSSDADHAFGSIVTKQSNSNRIQTYRIVLIKKNNDTWVINDIQLQ